MYRFKASKYKNAAAKIPKKEGWICDISVGSPQSCGNHIKASCALIAFNVDNAGGGSLAVVPINDSGRKSKSMPLLHAHSQLVTDLDFSPFNDYLLATCSLDCSIKIWNLPEGGLTESLSTPEISLPTQDRKVENVLFHPSADNILATSVSKTVKIWDITQQQEKIVLEGPKDQLQGLSWKQDGSLLATTSKDKKVRIFDPRSQTIASEVNGHGNIKDSRVCWLGDRDMLLSTGFSISRERQFYLWDTRNMGSKLSSESMDSSTGTIMPFFDPDTNMLFLAGKADTTVKFLELTDSDPYITLASNYMGDVQQKGVAMVPKRALNVMTGEVNRLLQLTQHAVVPITYQVPRKTYRDFHEDLFPDTLSGEPAMTSDQWLEGQNTQVSTTSLNPKKQSSATPSKRSQVLKSTNTTSNTAVKEEGTVNVQGASKKPDIPTKPNDKPALPTKPNLKSENDNSLQNIPVEKEADRENNDATQSAAVESSGPDALPEMTQNAAAQEEPPRQEEAQAKSNKFNVMYTSKFRHIEGVTQHKNTHVSNIRNLSMSTFGECDGFHANSEFAAIPLSGAGGLIAILDLKKPGRLPDTGLPVLQNGSTVMDFAWDPFNNRRIAVACDDAVIRVWEIPEGGLTETLTEPEIILKGHMEKIYFVKFHPLASDLLLSASYDMTMRLWDLEMYDERITLQGHSDQIFNATWSPDGVYLATVSKDTRVRIYNPRKSISPIKEGPGPEGSRGARLIYACNGQLLVIFGFNKQSTRQIRVYSTEDLSSPVTTVDLFTSPATLIPYYDEDTSVVFCTGKGDRTVLAFEVTTQSPYLIELSAFRCENIHQAISFLPKTECDVKQVEVAKALRLTKTTIEPVVFKVPRVKMEFFQDDLYPDTKVAWQPAMNACEWISGENKALETMSLKPNGMTALSDAPKAAPVKKKYESYKELEEYKSDEQKKQELLDAMHIKLEARDEPLPQDLMEGADDDEWDD
ncbi:coronin-7-like [Glandiceps talaboti]